MTRLRKIKSISSLLLCCLLLLSLPMMCFAAELTNQEVSRLQTIFNQLEQNNLEQDSRLQRASELLRKSETQINLLQEKLTLAENSIALAQTSLQRANQSLDKYEKETKGEIRKLKLQRDVLVVGLVAMFFKK